MNARWKAFAARIDALNLRERAFMFIALVVVVVALVDLLWQAPARQAYQRARQESVATSTELQRLRAAVLEQARAPNPERELRVQIDQVRAKLEELDRSIAMHGGPTRAAPGLQDLLVRVLRRYPARTLVRTTNGASAEPAVARASLPAPAPAASGTAAPRATPALQRQGLEVTVAGPYAELLRFVQTLETAMPELRWGAMRLVSGERVSELTLQLQLVRPQP
jgi:MSHA biogenesis protein MshJ